MRDVAIEVRGISKRYVRGTDRPLTFGRVVAQALPALFRRLPGRGGERRSQGQEAFWALKDVGFDVERGERVGIIGRNGAGKSTLLKILSRIVYPTEGEARIRGRVASLLEVGTGFNPGLTGRENIYLNASVHGLERREVEARFEDIVEFSGVREFLDTPVRHYSSGMFMRLAFSVAAHLEPDILLLDEVLAVGDLSFQQKCLKRVEGLTSEGRTVLFVSHSMDAITRFCTRCIWLDHGRVVKDGPALDVIEAYVEEVLEVRSSRRWVEEPAAAPPEARKPAQEAPSAEAPSALPPGPVPGNDCVRLVAARVVDRHGAPTTSIPVDEPLGIEVIYDVVKAGKIIQPALHFKTAQDAYAFVVAYTNPAHMHEAHGIGRYAATAWVPPNLLNTGIMHVTVVMATPDPLERHCMVERAISFNVYERHDRIEGTARGLYARDFPGSVRPRLAWETRRLDAPPALEETEAALADPSTDPMGLPGGR